MTIDKQTGQGSVFFDTIGKSVVDPDPYVFGPPGSGSVIICTDLDLNHSGFCTFSCTERMCWRRWLWTLAV
jgi:hypothetical protein